VKLEDEQRRLRGTLQDKGAKADRVADFVPDTIGRFKAALADLTAVTQYTLSLAVYFDRFARQWL